MRIVIDMQGAQNESRYRWIGRYTIEFVTHFVIEAKQRGVEVILALNDVFPERIEPIRAYFGQYLAQNAIRVWASLSPTQHVDPNNHVRRQSDELIREAFLLSLNPDVVLVPDLFAGAEDYSVTSIGGLSSNIPTVVILYDLIPLVYRQEYLSNEVIRDWYFDKLQHLQKADLLLAISSFTKNEALKYLDIPEQRIVNISSASALVNIGGGTNHQLLQELNIVHPFLLYCGGADFRKNLARLIKAYRQVPAKTRANSQLVLAGKMPPSEIDSLRALAKTEGLGDDAVIFTGYLSDEDLHDLYRCACGFVFPSYCEGFGLPVLEAMLFDLPVIGANISSIPEVIGNPDAMFDPFSVSDISRLMTQLLNDEAYRHTLIEYGKQQRNCFSWSESAMRAMDAIKQMHIDQQPQSFKSTLDYRPRLAYISPIPPDQTGIADYSVELIPELARLYEIDVIVDRSKITTSWKVPANCNIRSVQWFVENVDNYQRVLYHFGNSDFHQHMFDLLKDIPGIVVLHDFFLSNILCHMDLTGFASGCWTAELYRSHGYKALYERFHTENITDFAWKYPCSLSVIQNSLGVVTHSQNSLQLARQWYGSETLDWAVIPLLRCQQGHIDKKILRTKLGLSEADFVVCAFGLLGPTKLNHRLLNAWLKSCLARNKSCHLIFVGQNDAGGYGQELLAAIDCLNHSSNVRITGRVSQEVFHQYLGAADLGVQLRTLSRGETSAAVLDCMNYGLATIVNANGSMADLDATAVWMLPDEFSDEQLIEALESLWQDTEHRQHLGERAKGLIHKYHNPQHCAKQYGLAIEGFYHTADLGLSGLSRRIAQMNVQSSDDDLMAMAKALVVNFPPRNRQPQLLIDVSALVHTDLKTGIQRVVRSILNECLKNPPTGYRVEPVYATESQSYKYARQFTTNFLGCPLGELQDDFIEYGANDVFLGLDLHQYVVHNNEDFLVGIRNKGVQVWFVVYDLLPVLMPQAFPKKATEIHRRWLTTVSKFDGVLAISRSVADEYREWLEWCSEKRLRPLDIAWFHLGADIDASEPSGGLPENASHVLQILATRPTFLMVGTIEPRKGHTQTLVAFEKLWASKQDVNLVIVGKEGWHMEALVKKICNHVELNQRLFWLDGVSDEYLEKVYVASTCLIAASEGEGFGLPLIEAAQHKIPIIARDIPVFREVADGHAYYFSGLNADDLVSAVRAWLTLHQQGMVPQSDNMPWLTWKQSTEQLLEQVLGIQTTAS